MNAWTKINPLTNSLLGSDSSAALPCLLIASVAAAHT